MQCGLPWSRAGGVRHHKFVGTLSTHRPLDRFGYSPKCLTDPYPRPLPGCCTEIRTDTPECCDRVSEPSELRDLCQCAPLHAEGVARHLLYLAQTCRDSCTLLQVWCVAVEMLVSPHIPFAIRIVVFQLVLDLPILYPVPVSRNVPSFPSVNLSGGW